MGLVRSIKAGSFPDVMEGWASPPSGWLGRSSSGHEVSTDAAMTVSVIWRCINLVGGTLAKLPLQLYRPAGGDGRERADDVPEYPILHAQANASTTSYTWRKTSMLHLLTWGNAYSEIVRNGFGELVALDQMLPDRMERVEWEGGARVYYYRNGDGRIVRMTQDRVFHVPGLGFNGLVGKPPLTLMRETLGSYSSAREFGTAFFRNGARPGVILKHPKTMTAGAIERLTVQVDRLRGPGNSGKTVLLEEGADFKDVGFPPEDAQFIQTKDHDLNEFATWHGVPPHMVGLTDRSTSWGTGIEAQTLAFFLYTMDDWFVNWEQSIRSQLLPPPIFAEFTRDAMLRGDTATRFASYKVGRELGIYTPNRILRMENQEPRTDPGGDEYLRPLNYVAEGATDDQGRPIVRTIAVADDRQTPEVTIQ